MVEEIDDQKINNIADFSPDSAKSSPFGIIILPYLSFWSNLSYS